MAITFNCPCGKVLASKDRDAGLPAKCPACGRRVIVPGQRPPQPNSQEARRRATAKADRWLLTHTRQISICATVLALMAIIGVAIYTKAWRHLSPPVDDTMRAKIAPAAPVTLDPSADPALWKTSFDSFAVAVKQAIAANENLEAKFFGQEVRWEVTFAYTSPRNELYFAEVEPLRYGDRGVLVWAGLLKGAADKAEALERGQRITLRGKIGPITSGLSAEHPLGYHVVRPVECSIE